MGALDLSYLGVTIEKMEGPMAPITGVCMHHNVFSHFILLKHFGEQILKFFQKTGLTSPNKLLFAEARLYEYPLPKYYCIFIYVFLLAYVPHILFGDIKVVSNTIYVPI